MKKMVLALTLAALALSGTASAQYYLDNIGMYFDEGATITCDARPFGFYNAFVVLTNLTSPSIGGWEAKVTFTGGGLLTNVAYVGLAINAATRTNEYIVGLGEPLVADQGTLAVMSMTLYIFDTLVVTHGFVGPVYYNSIEGVELPCYLDGDDMELIKPLYPSLGTIDEPVLILNDKCSGPVANTPSSWGDLKSLYR